MNKDENIISSKILSLISLKIISIFLLSKFKPNKFIDKVTKNKYSPTEHVK